MQTFENIPKKKVMNFLEKWKSVKKQLPNGWEEWELNSKQGKKKISELHQMKLLMFNYKKCIYCKYCFEKGIEKKWNKEKGRLYRINSLKEDN